jgi:hypothetical protein
MEKNVSCSALSITWGPLGYQCLNCGAQADHSWNLKHGENDGQRKS